MPPKGKQHLTFTQIQEKKKALDEKLKLWVKKMEAEGITQPDAAKLQADFTKAELEGFCKRLQTQRGAAGLTISQAWDGLKQMGHQLAKAHRWKTLSQFLTNDDPQYWQQNVVTAYQEYTQSSTIQQTTEDLYLGELEVKHGKIEARKLINMGIWKKFTDADGLTKYLKVQKKLVNEKQKKTTARAERHRLITREVNTI